MTDTAYEPDAGGRYLHRAISQVRHWLGLRQAAATLDVESEAAQLAIAVSEFKRDAWHGRWGQLLSARTHERTLLDLYSEREVENAREWLKPLVAGRAVMDVVQDLHRRGLLVAATELQQLPAYGRLSRSMSRLLMALRESGPEYTDRLQGSAELLAVQHQRERERERLRAASPMTIPRRAASAEPDYRNPR